MDIPREFSKCEDGSYVLVEPYKGYVLTYGVFQDMGLWNLVVSADGGGDKWGTILECFYTQDNSLSDVFAGVMHEREQINDGKYDQELPE